VNKITKWLVKSLWVAGLGAILAGCGGSGSSDSANPVYSLSGTLSGLNGAVTVTANATNYVISSNGNINLGSGFTSGTSVSVTVSTQPVGQICVVESASTVVFSDANISNVKISCTDLQYSIEGTASGVTSPVSLIYQVADATDNQITIATDGTFVVADNFNYNDQVSFSISAPASLRCEVAPATINVTADVDNLSVECEPALTVNGSVTGLVRAITVEYRYADLIKSTELTENGPFSLPDGFASGTAVEISIVPSIGHQCSLTTRNIVVTQDINNLNISCETFGVISGRVSAYSSGSAIDGAKIQVYLNEQDSEPVLLDTLSTDESGNFNVAATGYYDRISLRTTADNFVTRSEVVQISEVNSSAIVNIALLDRGYSETFSSATAKEIIDPASAMKIVLPANAFANAQNAIYSGEVTAAVTNVDASSDPAVMPGYYLAVDPNNGEEQAFESFGALNAVFQDANGDALQLADNVVAQIRIPLATRGTNPPATIPLIHFDEQTGIWTVEGEATLMTDDQGRRYYAGEVGHFSTWNADVLFDSVTITGCALDNQTQSPIPGVRLIADGVDYIGRSIAYTNAAGEFTIAVRPNSEVLLSIRDDEGQSNTMRVDIGNNNIDLDNCLTTDQGAMIVSLAWGANPRDLDTHFKGPRVADSLIDRFHIYFSRRSATVEGVTMYLDVDDTSSYGPEILTVPRFPVPGRYVYSVHHYAGSGTIYQSPTRVEVLLNGLSYVFTPSADENTAGSNDTWMVFEVVVSENGSVELIALDSYTSVGDNDIPAAAMYNVMDQLPAKVSLK
tara:strand:- start:3687 stop:6071 length:2385 start_codon:yes stop_codon:yes gene_type:complete